MDRLNHDLSKTQGSNSFRCARMCCERTYATRASLVGLVLGFCLVAAPLGVLAGDEPQELPKPFHKTTPPLFQEWQFDKSGVDAIPEEFSLEVGSTTVEGEWLVKEDSKAPSRPNAVEQQLTCSKEFCYHLLLAKDLIVEYVDLSVRMKMRLGAPSGKAGLAYGVQDAKNFYAVVVEPKTNEVVAYVVKDGAFKELARESLILESSEWHFLRIQRNTIISKEFTEIFFDHHLLIDVYDQSFKKGKIGLVAMGNSAFSFDNFRAMELMTNRPLSRPAAY